MKKLLLYYCFSLSFSLCASEQKEQHSISLELLSEIPLQESPDYYFFSDEKTILIATNNDLQRTTSSSSSLEGDRTLVYYDIFSGKIINTKNETVCEMGHPFDTKKHIVSPSTSIITVYNKQKGTPYGFQWNDEQSSYSLEKKQFVTFDYIDYHQWKSSPLIPLFLYIEKGLLFPCDENNDVVFDILPPHHTHFSLWKPPFEQPLFKKTTDLALVESTLDQLGEGALFLMENNASHNRSLVFVDCAHKQPIEKRIDSLLTQEKLASIKDMVLLKGAILLLTDKKMYGLHTKDDSLIHSIKNKTHDAPNTIYDPFESLFIDPITFNAFIKHKNNHFSFINLKKDQKEPVYKCFELVRRKIINTITPSTTGDSFALATTSCNSVSSIDNFNYSIAHFKINPTITNVKENAIEKIILHHQDYDEITTSIPHFSTPESSFEEPEDFVTIKKDYVLPSSLLDEKQQSTDPHENTKNEYQRLSAFVTFIKSKLF